VHDHSTDLSKRIRSDADESQGPTHPIAEILTLRQRLTKLVQVLAARHKKPRTD
jgi:hypothetical protein